MSLGSLEHDIRQLPGVLACQFTPTEVFVLVAPSADAAVVTAAVESLLAAAAQARRVAVIGGTAAAGVAVVPWWRRKRSVAAGAAVASFLAAASAAAVTGVLTGESHPAPRPVAAPAARPGRRQEAPPEEAAPAHTAPPVSSTTTTTAPGTPAAAPAAAPSASASHQAQIIRVALPAPLPNVVSTQLPVAPPPVKPPVTLPPARPPSPPPPPPPPPVLATCNPSQVITSYYFTINGIAVPSLHGIVKEGDVVEAFFTIAEGCHSVPVSFVSHTSPDPVFIKSHAWEQRVFQASRGKFDAGSHSLGPVTVPMCDFQIDLEATAQGTMAGFTYSSAVGGLRSCGDAVADDSTLRRVW